MCVTASENACNSSLGIRSYIGVRCDYKISIAFPIKSIFIASSTEIYELGNMLCRKVKLAFQSSSASASIV